MKQLKLSVLRSSYFSAGDHSWSSFVVKTSTSIQITYALFSHLHIYFGLLYLIQNLNFYTDCSTGTMIFIFKSIYHVLGADGTVEGNFANESKNWFYMIWQVIF